MLSRVANSICWMARYMERTNGMLRLLRTNYIASQNELNSASWRSILQLYSDLPNEKTNSLEQDSLSVIEHLMFDAENSFSVCNNIIRARENARAVQDNITKELWQCLNEYYHLIRNQQLRDQVISGDPVSALDALIQQGMLYYGTVDNTMARGEGFNFLNIGKLLERSILSLDMLTIRITESNGDGRIDGSVWRYLLNTLSGYELYLKTYRGKFVTAYVVDQVIYNTDFPHSVLYCLTEMNRYFERLKTCSLPESFSQVEFRIGRTLNNVKYSNADHVQLTALLEFLSVTRKEIMEISNTFNKYYFGHN
jgi:uncharacterized alpha-E superfamily protein